MAVLQRLPLILAALGAPVWSGCGNGSDEGSGLGGSAGTNASGNAGSQAGGASGSGGTRSNEGGTMSAGGGTSGVGFGGSATGGTTGSAMGGAANGGSGGVQASGSPGCGATQPLESGRFTIDINGTEREYVLDVPSSYAASHPYRLIFAWHWVGVTADDVVSGEPGPYGGLGPYYGLKALADETAIFVAPQGIDNGWLNEDDVDIEFARGMLEHFNANLCIDQDRIFSTGFSYGAMMSIAVGCELGDVFRAIAAMSGSRLSGCNLTKDDPIAFWGAHGDGDMDVAPEEGRSARDVFVERNHCQEQTAAIEPSPCVAYAGCDAGYPVDWCEFSGDHTQWPSAPEPIWTFLAQF